MGLGPGEVVERRQQCPHHFGDGDLAVGLTVTLDALPEVHQLGLRTEHVRTHLGDEVAVLGAQLVLGDAAGCVGEQCFVLRGEIIRCIGRRAPGGGAVRRYFDVGPLRIDEVLGLGSVRGIALDLGLVLVGRVVLGIRHRYFLSLSSSSSTTSASTMSSSSAGCSPAGCSPPAVPAAASCWL